MSCKTIKLISDTQLHCLMESYMYITAHDCDMYETVTVTCLLALIVHPSSSCMIPIIPGPLIGLVKVHISKTYTSYINYNIINTSIGIIL